MILGAIGATLAWTLDATAFFINSRKIIYSNSSQYFNQYEIR